MYTQLNKTIEIIAIKVIVSLSTYCRWNTVALVSYISVHENGAYGM